MDFYCVSCGKVFDVYERTEYEIELCCDLDDNGNMVAVKTAFVDCPFCGQTHLTTERMYWDGKTEVEKYA